MTTPRRFEADLPALLADLYPAGTPDYRDDIVRRTARMRQRPAWTFPERWLPMELVTSRVPTTRMRWRQVGVLALISILLAAAVAAYVGSRQPSLPPPFGVVGNGLVAYGQGGDIYTTDPRTGSTTSIVVGPETDVRPIWSLDGSRLAFERKVEGDTGPGWLFVARDDGRGLVRVTPTPSDGLTGWSFSPDGRSVVAFVTDHGVPSIMVVPADGSAPPALFHVWATSDDGPPQYRPDGSEITFIGRKPGDANRGIYALDPSNGHVRSVIAASTTIDIWGASWSPDGKRIAYGTSDGPDPNVPARTHVALADGSGDVAIDPHPESVGAAGTAWSNDGTRLIIARIYRRDGQDIFHNAVVPIDRSSLGVEIECPSGASPTDCVANWAWSPDDSVLIGTWSDATGGSVRLLLADPSTGVIRPAPWTATGDPTWQRVAR
jgi:dipeptidyl aminopeptidase/acylaminoacyl peptidase